jgi:hypothetical protein
MLQTRRAVVALSVFVLVTCLPAPASAHVSLFLPVNFATAQEDEAVHFSWFADQSEDFFRVVVAAYPSGFMYSSLGTRQTILTSIDTTPAEMGLTPGTWYWTICAGWDTTPSTCYLDDETRTLFVESPPPPPPALSLASAKAGAKQVARRRWKARRPRARCARVDRSSVLCRVTWRKKSGRRRSRLMEIFRESDGSLSYSVR